MTIELRGITWDHPRGYDCLAANTALFTERHPDIKVTWDRRTLREFGEQPIDELCKRYDIVVVDHPFVGHAHATGCLIDLRRILPEAEIARMLDDSVGPSTESYHYRGGVYGLPTDTAAQVAAYRSDLMTALGIDPPETFDEVLRLARRTRENGMWIILPAVPIDAICMLLTLTANLGSPFREDTDILPDPAAIEDALARIAELLALAHPTSLDRNPIQAFDAMTTDDDLVYCPLAFGYSNYSRTGVAKPLQFTDIAGPGPEPTRGALLGGAGCAVTHSATEHDAIAAYLRFVHNPEHQRTDYFKTGGQPGSRAAWLDPDVNAASRDFFAETLTTLDQAYQRPRHDGFIDFFEAAGHLLNEHFRAGSPRRQVIGALQELYDRALENAGA